MTNIKIPNIPLSMPDKSIIYKKPSYPYEYHTHGIIRGKDFERLVDILLKNYLDDSLMVEKLEEWLGHHSIKDTFPDWDLQELSDFCRHVLKINQDFLGWDLADQVLLELNSISIPGWRIPNFDFVKEFEHTLSQVRKLYFSDRLRQFLQDLFDDGKTEEMQLNKEVKVHLHLWTVKDLWLLLSYMTKIEKSKEKIDGVSQIINLISNDFEEMIKDPGIEIKNKVCLILLYIDGIDGLNKKFTMRSKELIDQIWEDIKELPYIDKISFKYLLGAAYSMVGEHLFRQNTDFVTRKLFIDNFIQNYVSEDYDLGRWFADLLDYDMDELIFDLLIRGYSKTVPLLHYHSQELPESKTKSDIILRIEQFNHILTEMLIFHLEIPDDPEHIHLIDSLDLFPEKVTFEKTRMNMLELMYQVATYSVFYNRSMSSLRKLQLYAATYYLLNVYYDRDRADIFDIDFKLNSGTYEFEGLYNKIMGEVKDTRSLVLSETFENEIVQKISTALAYVETISSAEILHLEIYEIILQFLLEWLKVLSKDESDFKEVLLLFSPMINICFFNQIKWYYQNNFAKKAFLMNLNLHSFMNYFSHRLDRFENLHFDRLLVQEPKGISEKYKELTERWEIRDLLKQEQIKEIIIDARGKFKDSGLNERKPTQSLIEDALIHGYLDEIDRLEKFISTDITLKRSEKLEKLLVNSGIFKLGDHESTYRLERIIITDERQELIPVPLFNNIHRLSIATEFFNIKSKGIENLEERNKKIQSNYVGMNK